MGLADHGRFGYSPITDRPAFVWPGGARLALYVALAIEHFPYGEGGLGLGYSPGMEQPNTYNWAWREYGNRVGGFRLLDDLRTVGIPPTVLLNTAAYDHCAPLVDACRDAGAEMVGHGVTNAVHPNDLDDPALDATVAEVRAAILAHEGRPPGGWMSPGANPSRTTEDVLARHGYRYTLDWPHDEQPTWLRTAHGPLLSVPYPQDLNDVPLVVLHHASGREFAEAVVDGVDELLEQAAERPLVCGIVVHSFIVGQAHRLRPFRRALEHLAGLDGVWRTTAGAVAEQFAAQVPPPSG